MQFTPTPILATFIKRLNRFEAIIKIDQTEHLCHVPNTGRLRELLLEGARVYVQYFDNPKRKTKYKLILVEKEGIFISIDSAGVPNKVVHEALLGERLEEFKGYSKVSKEVTFGDSRFDFFLSSHEESCFIEVKGVTLVNDGVAMFPDAPTERGAKHLDELVKAKQEGLRAAVVFLIQRKDVDYFTPHDEMDKKFGNKVREAHGAGVEFYAYACEVSVEGVEIVKRVDVRL